MGGFQKSERCAGASGNSGRLRSGPEGGGRGDIIAGKSSSELRVWNTQVKQGRLAKVGKMWVGKAVDTVIS